MLAARSGADFDRHIPKGAQARSRVNLVGVHALFEQEQSVRLSEDERHDLVRDNTRKLYMALTRAGQRVVLTYVGEPPDAVLQYRGGPDVSVRPELGTGAMPTPPGPANR